MAITYITQIQRESADGTTAVLKDLTTYTSPARNTLALFLKFVKRSALLVDTSITIDNSIPLTVTEWTFNLAGGGWYRAAIFGFPIYSAGTYAANACVYYSTNGRYYKSKSGGVVSVPTTTADWDELTDPTSIENTASTNVEINYTDNWTTYDADVPVGDQLALLSDQIVNGVPKDWEDTTVALIGLALINGSWVKHYRTLNQDGQKIVDFINQKYPNRV